MKSNQLENTELYCNIVKKKAYKDMDQYLWFKLSHIHHDGERLMTENQFYIALNKALDTQREKLTEKAEPCQYLH